VNARGRQGPARLVVALLPALVAAASACGGGAPGAGGPIRFETGRRAEVTADGLHRVRSTRISRAYLKPGASFTGYYGVLIEPVEVFYKRPPRDPRSVGNQGRGNFALEPREMERFRTLFQETFEAELGESRLFTIVQEPGPDVLRIRAHIVDLVVNTPPERGRDRVYVSVSGEMTLILDVSDSQSLEPLARIAERRAVQPGGPSGGLRRAGVLEWAEVRRIFRAWARVLREGLEELPTLGPVPMPENAG
jgi:hypothetical protein